VPRKSSKLQRESWPQLTFLRAGVSYSVPRLPSFKGSLLHRGKDIPRSYSNRMLMTLEKGKEEEKNFYSEETFSSFIQENFNH
jgi:hypothetical protein